MAHESLTRVHRIEGSSDRTFGLVFAAMFLVLAFWPMMHAQPPRWWASGVALFFALAALIRPTLLTGLNRWWMKLGLLMGKVVSPIALGILFYGVLTPVGLAIRRVVGTDMLRLRRDPALPSYWLPRQPPGPPPKSMTQQF